MLSSNNRGRTVSSSNIDSHDFQSRLTRTEATVEALADDIRALAHSFQTHTLKIEEHLDKVIAEVATSGKINWNVLISACFLVITLVGAAFTPVYMMTNFNKDAVDKRATIENVVQLEKAFSEHLILEGHPGVLAKAAQLATSIEAMKQSDATMKEQLRVLEDQNVWFMRTRVTIQAEIAAVMERLHMEHHPDKNGEFDR